LGEFFTDENFANKSLSKGRYIQQERIVCQQISNIHLEKRLKFAKIPGNIVLGNSCNFLTFNESLFGNNHVTLDYLLGILNSLLLNWRFKVTNSNNHISNYELAELPIVIPTKKQKEEIERLVERIKGNKHPNAINELNEKVFNLYGLSEEEKSHILGKHEKTVNKNFILKQNNLFQYASI
jgi:Alw26I/Eco31I/Esp3I family type II restriction m6 adenine DNA methyltransferase